MKNLPTGWQFKQLDQVSKVVNGGTPKTKVEEYWGGQHYWITPAEMGKGSSPYLSESRRMLTDSGLQKSSAQLIPPWSVILSTRAPIGYLAINSVPMAFNQGCRGLIPEEGLAYKFLYYFLLSSTDTLNSLGTGATFKELSAGKLKKVQIPLPPLPEQKRIVAILDEAFAGIDQAIANTEKNLANAHEVFESYLNGVFTRKGAGWADKKLSEILETGPRNGWSPPAKNHSDKGTPVVSLSSVTGFEFNLSKIKFTSAPVKPEAHYWLENGALLITRSNTPELVGHVAVCSGLNEPIIYPDLIMKMMLNKDVADTRFIYYQLRSKKLRKLIMNSAQGANPTMKKINKSVVQNLPISLPILQKQKTIVERIDAIWKETRLLESIYQKKLTALAELKQSILHKAFTGELAEAC